MPRQKSHTVRVDEELWDAASSRAQDEGTNISAVVRQVLAAYVAAPRKHPHRRKGDVRIPVTRLRQPGQQLPPRAKLAAPARDQQQLQRGTG